jgi:GntR family transcriptional regulator, transcriptional repressor for pyruvate dehydrogenase complex
MRARAADQIITEMRARIASGALPLGSKLPSERELAASFGVSPPTAREAFRGLSSMGLVEIRHGSGAYVAARSDSLLDSSLAMLVQLGGVGVLDLIGLLTKLNLYVAELAVDNATADDIERMRLAAEATANPESAEDVAAAVTDFLVSFVASAHQPLLDALCGFLIRMVVQLESASHKTRTARFWKRWSGDTSAFRLEIVRALDSRDGERLAVAVARYHEHVHDRIMRVPSLRRARMSDPTIVSFLAGTTPGR